MCRRCYTRRVSDHDPYPVNPEEDDLADLPEIVMFGDARHRTAEQRLGPHYNAGIEICLSRSGVYRWDVEGRPVEIRPGECSITLPWQKHSGQNRVLGPGRLSWIILAAGGRDQLDAPLLAGLLGSEAREVLAALSGRPGDEPAGEPRAYLGPVPEAVVIFDRLATELPSRRLGRRATVSADLARLLVVVARRLTEMDRIPEVAREPVPASVLRVLRAVEAQPDVGWTAAFMAEEAGLGPTAFTEWCRRVTGRSPRWYVLASRLERARTLLAEGDRSVTDVAIETGFSSSQHLSSAFRKLYGESPSDFRKSLRLSSERKAEAARWRLLLHGPQRQPLDVVPLQERVDHE